MVSTGSAFAVATNSQILPHFAPSTAQPLHRHVPRRRALNADFGEELKDLQRKLTNVSLGLPGGDNDMEEVDIENLLPQHENVITAAIQSSSTEYQTKALIKLRKFLCLDNVIENTEKFLALNILHDLLSFLDFDYPETMVYETCWIVTNVSAGSSQHTLAIANAGFIPALIKLLYSPFGSVRTQAAWALGNLAGENIQLRDKVLKEGMLTPLLQIWKGEFENELRRRSALHVQVWVLANLCRWKRPDWDVMQPAFTVLEEALGVRDDEILAESCWALSRIFHNRHDNIDKFMRGGVCAKLVGLLESDNPTILNPVLRALTNIASGDDDQTQIIIDSGVLPALRNLIFSDSYPVRLEALMVISNIAAGNLTQVQFLINTNVLHMALKIMDEQDAKLRREVCWILSNASSVKDRWQTSHLLTIGVLQTVFKFLNECTEDYHAMQKALECISNILASGDEKEVAGVIETSHGFQNLLKAAHRVASGVYVPDDHDIVDFEWYSDLTVSPVTPKERVVYLFVSVLQKWFGSQMTERVSLSNVLLEFANVSIG